MCQIIASARSLIIDHRYITPVGTMPVKIVTVDRIYLNDDDLTGNGVTHMRYCNSPNRAHPSTDMLVALTIALSTISTNWLFTCLTNYTTAIKSSLKQLSVHTRSTVESLKNEKDDTMT